jgi:ABC-type bacteriocin/lantibiotic exporter with double-glycine peptidase domain
VLGDRVKYQRTEYYCGPASVQGALAILGVKYSQDALARCAGTSEAHGTDEDGIKRMMFHAGRVPDELATDSELVAFGWLWHSLLYGRPVVLCVDRWQHWVVAVGLIGKRVVLFDPARYRHNTARLGTFSLPRGKLLKRWFAARRVRRNQPAYYGVNLGGPA